ncbi:MAG: redox-sensing transcriptional repressor Rex [Deltaproteobacteria bacterium]|nr:redox-sensing transcriptional repressor Rex [Deltaproteobacteria bacterium]
MSRALAGRLARYREIVDAARTAGKAYVSSDACGRELHVDGTLVRKDMACLGVVGKPHVGYPVADVLSALEKHVDEQTQRAAVLVGAGNMGTALVTSATLERHGVHLEAVFDRDGTKVGLPVGRHQISPIDQLESMINQCGAKLGVVTVPADSAQEIIDRMARAGIKVIWNFAPIRPQVPMGVRVLNEHLAESVGRLSRYLDEAEHKVELPVS